VDLALGPFSSALAPALHQLQELENKTDLFLSPSKAANEDFIPAFKGTASEACFPHLPRS
jgi:hypothetical protein